VLLAPAADESCDRRVTLGAAFCTNSSGSAPDCRDAYGARKAIVSFEVENEFISIKASSTPNVWRMCST
jgi:hypothetical protein